VHWVTDGTLALEFLEAHAPALILLDVRVHGMDAQTFLRRMRARASQPHPPVVLLTALHDIVGLQTELGADSAIAKPFELDTLLSVVERYAPLP
jgi:two-component system, OmpR family, response regulator BaeR